MSIEPTNAQKVWMEMGYGMFLHFGPNTLEGKGWGEGNFPAEKFNFEKLDVSQWAETAREAGMRYAVLTTKHHDGFCLWPSKYTEYCVKNSPLNKDIVRLFVDEFRKNGIKTGFYYSLWDRNFPGYENDDVYADYMKNQLTELFTQYGEIVYIFFDGLWDKDHPTRRWEFEPGWKADPHSGLGHGERWHWRELYDLIHKLQPDCIVANNSCSDNPGEVKYFPVDARTAEHFDFIYKERIFFPRYDQVWKNEKGEEVFLPLEFNTTLNPDWFYTGVDFYLHPSVDTICGWYRTAREHGANLLLNAGPNMDGLIPDYNRYFLKEAAIRLGLQKH